MQRGMVVVSPVALTTAREQGCGFMKAAGFDVGWNKLFGGIAGAAVPPVRVRA